MCRLTMFQFLHFVLFGLHLLPSALGDNLRCYYSPILHKEKPFDLIETECPPDELCFKADGLFGNYSALTARGCMPRKDCSQVHKIRIRGIVYTMSYSCCEGPYCNTSSAVTATYLQICLMLVSVAVLTRSS